MGSRLSVISRHQWRAACEQRKDRQCNHERGGVYPDRHCHILFRQSDITNISGNSTHLPRVNLTLLAIFSIGALVFPASSNADSFPAPNSPDYWFRSYQVPEYLEFTVIVVKVKDVRKALDRVSDLCRRYDCKSAERPEWYTTAADEIRTQDEAYWEVPAKHQAVFTRELSSLGTLLQFSKPNQPASPPSMMAELKEKQSHLQRERRALTPLLLDLPGICGLLEYRLQVIDGLLRREERAKQRALVNLRFARGE